MKQNKLLQFKELNKQEIAADFSAAILMLKYLTMNEVTMQCQALAEQ